MGPDALGVPGVILHGYDVSTKEPATADTFLSGRRQKGQRRISACLVACPGGKLDLSPASLGRTQSVSHRCLPHTFIGRGTVEVSGHSGVVLAPAAVKNALLCSFYTDFASALVGGSSPLFSQKQPLPGCVGSYSPSRGTVWRDWCGPEGSNYSLRPPGLSSAAYESWRARNHKCAYRPSQLELMLQHQTKWVADTLRNKKCLDGRQQIHRECYMYNELILNVTKLKAELAIEGIYFLDPVEAAVSRELYSIGKKQALALQANLRASGIAVPLVGYDMRNLSTPFRMALQGPLPPPPPARRHTLPPTSSPAPRPAPRDGRLTSSRYARA
mmetsp:Transcript_29862/g.97981  ORF Transcript_29862/g.97981 Transcript_29862/m.97981 type:complete len:329 (+) Transcript_29862:3-989(+)